MADLADLRVLVRDRVGLPATDGMAADASVDKAINAALQELSAEADWPWLLAEETLTATANTDGYALPTRYARTLYIIDPEDGRELEYRSRRQLASIYESERDRPRFYSGGVGELLLFPTPDASYSLIHGYIAAEPVLSTGTDEPLLPENYTEALVTLAARKLAIRLKDPERLGLLTAEWAAWLARLRDEQRRTKSFGRVKTFFRGV